MYNVIKFQAPFERLKLYQKSADISLFKSIIMQAIIDATNKSTDHQSKRIAKDARDWIFGNSKDFQMICLAAEMEPSFVVSIAIKVIKLHDNNSYNIKLKKNQKIKNSIKQKFKAVS